MEELLYTYLARSAPIENILAFAFSKGQHVSNRLVWERVQEAAHTPRTYQPKLLRCLIRQASLQWRIRVSSTCDVCRDREGASSWWNAFRKHRLGSLTTNHCRHVPRDYCWTASARNRRHRLGILWLCQTRREKVSFYWLGWSPICAMRALFSSQHLQRLRLWLQLTILSIIGWSVHISLRCFVESLWEKETIFLKPELSCLNCSFCSTDPIPKIFCLIKQKQPQRHI